MTKYEKLKLKLEEVREEMSKCAKETMEEGAKELFKKFPELKSFGWRQYIPSFNDGDPCTFRSLTDCPDINGFNDEFDEVEEDEDGNELEKPKDFDKMALAIKEHLAQFEDEDLQEMYSYNVKVVITREGITTDDYDCGY